MRLGTSTPTTEANITQIQTLRVVQIAIHPNYGTLNGVYFDAGIAIPEKPIVFINYSIRLKLIG
jgi:hypothetical protein